MCRWIYAKINILTLIAYTGNGKIKQFDAWQVTALTSVTLFGRQFDFYDVIDHVKPCNFALDAVMSNLHLMNVQNLSKTCFSPNNIYWKFKCSVEDGGIFKDWRNHSYFQSLVCRERKDVSQPRRKCHSNVTVYCIIDQCNDDLACDIVSRTTWHAFNVPHIYHPVCWVVFHALCYLPCFAKSSHSKNISRISFKWIQIVCKVYQQTTLLNKELK